MNILDVMTANEGYCARHTDTPLALQDRAKLLCWQYNQTRPDEGSAVRRCCASCSETAIR